MRAHLWPGVVLEAVQWPDDHSGDVHQHCQHIAACQDFVKWCREERQKAADGKNDDNEGKDEANGVDSNTPLEPWILRVKTGVQAGEDDAGHKGLQNLEEAWDCGQKSTNLTRFSPGQPNLKCIQDEGQTGSNSGTNLFAAVRTSEEDRIDDGCCQHHKSTQHGKSGSEVIPGNGQLSVETGEFQKDYEEGDAEAEAPCEHAPRPEGISTVAH